MRGATLALVGSAALAAGGCGKEKVRRAGDAGPPVVVVGDKTDLVTFGAEQEPNDTPEAAGALALPGGVSGELGEGDVDRFAFTAAQDGEVSLKLVGGELDGVLEATSPDGKTTYRSDRGPAGTVEGLPNLPVRRGERYVVSATRFAKKAGKGKGGKGKGGKDGKDEAATGPATYKLSAEVVAVDESAEREPNEDAGSAREIALGGEGGGFIGWLKDLDVWQLAVADAAAGLDVSVDGIEGVALTVELRRGTEPIVVRRGGKGEGVALRGLVLEGVDRVLARISGDRSNPEAGYRLRSTARPLEADEEREPNDDEDRATPLALQPGVEQGRVRGFLDGGDVDVWRVSASEPIVLGVATVTPPGADLTLRAGLAGGRELARVDGGKQGAAEKLDEIAVAPGRDVFIEVSGTATADLIDGYTLTWSYFPGRPAAPSPLEPQPSE